MDLEILKKLIELLDGYRVYYFGDPDSLDPYVRSGMLGREIMLEWRKIYKTILKMTKSLRGIPKLKKYIILQSFLRVLTISINLMVVILFLITIFMRIWSTYLFAAITVLVITGVSSLAASWIFGRYSAMEIQRFFDEHEKKHKFKREFFKSFNQKLINSLAVYLKSSKDNPSKYKMYLFNTDYKKIKVLKKSLFGRKFEVIVNIE